jgi:hypothetical protein
VRFYRDGHYLAGQSHVPNGRFEVRHLAPGQYVARDELGGEQAFVVPANTETAMILKGPDPMGHDEQIDRRLSAEPGTSYQSPTEITQVGVRPGQEREGEPSYPKEGSVVVPTHVRGDDQRVPGAPGSGAVQEGVLGPSAYTYDDEGEPALGPGEVERRRTIAQNKARTDTGSPTVWATDSGPGGITQDREREINREKERDLSELSKPLGRRTEADTPVSGPNPPATGAADELVEEGPAGPGEQADKFPARGEPAPRTEADVASRRTQQEKK